MKKRNVENTFFKEYYAFKHVISWIYELIIESIERWTCRQPRNEKLMTKEGYSAENGAENLLLSHITMVFSASSVNLQL